MFSLNSVEDLLNGFVKELRANKVLLSATEFLKERLNENITSEDLDTAEVYRKALQRTSSTANLTIKESRRIVKMVKEGESADNVSNFIHYKNIGMNPNYDDTK